MKDAMTPNQHARAAELTERAQKALQMCSSEDLGLNEQSRGALVRARDAVEEFHLFTIDQPTEGQLL